MNLADLRYLTGLLRDWAARRPRRNERGDVPGWVMITVMTIVISSAILTLFQHRVTTFLSHTLGHYM